MKVVVSEVERQTASIVSITMRSADDTPLPHYEAGSHIDVYLPGDIVRQYSLCGVDDGSGTYRIAVKLEKDSRGGSIAIHRLEVGDELEISEPRNNFELVFGASFYVLIAAGVGIAPIFAMAKSLKKRGSAFTVMYFARSSEEAALVSELALTCPDEALMVFGSGRREQQPVFYRRLLEACPNDTQFYVCGPQGFMDTARGVAGEYLPEEQIHSEHFRPDESKLEGTLDEHFIVEFEGAFYEIPPGKSILEVFDEEDVPVLSSCEEGTCGKCAMQVVEGEVEHRDSIFSKAQHEKGMMATCVSRAKGLNLKLERIKRN